MGDKEYSTLDESIAFYRSSYRRMLKSGDDKNEFRCASDRMFDALHLIAAAIQREERDREINT